jgi:hypothetical protein
VAAGGATAGQVAARGREDCLVRDGSEEDDKGKIKKAKKNRKR